MMYKFDNLEAVAVYFERNAKLERDNIKGTSPRSKHDELCRSRASVWESAAHILRDSNLTNPPLPRVRKENDDHD